jgi:ATP-dependent Clp protease protease subunit
MRTIVEKNNKGIVVMDVLSKLVEQRIVFIDDEIEGELVTDIICQLLYLDSISNDPINIYINTPGGSVYDGFAIYDTIKLLKSPVFMVGLGSICSMGFIILLASKHRRGLPHSYYMVHQVTSKMVGTTSHISSSVSHTLELQNRLYEIIKKETKIKDPDIMLRDDTWFNVDQALELNILTEKINDN